MLEDEDYDEDPGACFMCGGEGFVSDCFDGFCEGAEDGCEDCTTACPNCSQPDGPQKKPQLPQNERSATPAAFRDLMLVLARTNSFQKAERT